MRFSLPIFISLCSILSACSTNPVTGKLDFTTLSEQEEINRGQQAKARFLAKSPPYNDADLVQYVNKIGQSLARNSHRSDIHYSFTILDSPTINAFAIYGGHVMITRGMLAHLDNEAELAAFLGHEIAHISARHGVKLKSQNTAANVARILTFNVLAFTEASKKLTQKLSDPFIFRNNQEYEVQADELSAGYLVKTGYNPSAMISSIRFLKQLSDYNKNLKIQSGLDANDTHRFSALYPDSEIRLQTIIENAQIDTNKKWRTNNGDLYLRLINHTDYGYNEKYGIAVDNVIYYKPHNLKITLPEDWMVTQKGYQYEAISPDGNAVIKLAILLPTKATPQESISLSIKNGARRFGMHGSILNKEVNTTQGKKFAELGLFPYKNKVLLLVNGYSDKANSLNKALLSIEKQLMPIPLHEQHFGNTRKLRIITAQTGDTYEKLARKSHLGKSSEMRLRLLNRAWPDGEIQAGQKIKIIE